MRERERERMEEKRDKGKGARGEVALLKDHGNEVGVKGGGAAMWNAHRQSSMR